MPRICQKKISYSNVVIEPYQYDMALEYIEAYRPSTEINNLIEIYLILKLLKTENEFSRFKHLIRKFHNDLSANFPITIFEIDYDSIYIFYKDVFWGVSTILRKN